MTARHYYGFEFTGNANTTSGGDHGAPLHIAGTLHAFNSADERNDWARGVKRVAVTRRSLPMGWGRGDIADAIEQLTLNEWLSSDEGVAAQRGDALERAAAADDAFEAWLAISEDDVDTIERAQG